MNDITITETGQLVKTQQEAEAMDYFPLTHGYGDHEKFRLLSVIKDMQRLSTPFCLVQTPAGFEVWRTKAGMALL